MPMGWYEDRFIPNQSRTECSCINCGKKYWLPKCEIKRRITCGALCQAEMRIAKKIERQRHCLKCGEVFLPRTTQVALGQGQFCSLRCSTTHQGQLWTKPAREKAVSVLRSSIDAGEFIPKSGPQHHQWTGGKKVSRDRRRDSGKGAEALRNYRKKNPEKAKEFSVRRSGRKLGKLPSGTVKKIGMMQRWKCAICHVDAKEGYHVDHVIPLALGGKHEPLNLQILCPTCNVRKAAKHPIDYMQSIGLLL